MIIIEERQPKDSTSFPLPKDGHNQPADEKANSNGIDDKHNTQMGTYFFAKVRHIKNNKFVLRDPTLHTATFLEWS
jgi:hypothetical protein